MRSLWHVGAMLGLASAAGGIASFRFVWERPEVISRALALPPAFIATHDELAWRRRFPAALAWLLR